jgi:hypothetical protein
VNVQTQIPSALDQVCAARREFGVCGTRCRTVVLKELVPNNLSEAAGFECEAAAEFELSK